MPYLLDTNILIAAMKGTRGVRRKLEATPLTDLILSPIVLGELELGAEKSQHRDKNYARLAHITQGIPLAPIDAETSRHYATLRAELERIGTPIGANDYWIAAQGRALNAVVVTDNLGEFSRVPDLVVENWLDNLG